MDVTKACSKILTQLTDLIYQLGDDDFSKPSEALSRSSIGQHLRHTLEFFICFEEGYRTGRINYDKRAHDRLIETDRFVALNTIQRIDKFVQSLQLNLQLKLEVGYDVNSDSFATVETNALRELVYNIEHAVHHMAIMKIGIREVAPYITLAPDFGVAASTLRHKEKQTQPSQD